MIFHRKTEFFSNQTLLLHAELKHKNYLQLLYVYKNCFYYEKFKNTILFLPRQRGNIRKTETNNNKQGAF